MDQHYLKPFYKGSAYPFQTVSANKSYRGLKNVKTAKFF